MQIRCKHEIEQQIGKHACIHHVWFPDVSVQGRADATRPLQYRYDALALKGSTQGPHMVVPEGLDDLSFDRHPPMPTRPDWRKLQTCTPQQLESMETDAFEDWKEVRIPCPVEI